MNQDFGEGFKGFKGGKGFDKGLEKGKGFEKGLEKGKGFEKGLEKGKGFENLEAGKGKGFGQWGYMNYQGFQVNQEAFGVNGPQHGPGGAGVRPPPAAACPCGRRAAGGGLSGEPGASRSSCSLAAPR